MFRAKIRKNIIFFFQLKIFNFYNLGKICISHGHVFVMSWHNFCTTLFYRYPIAVARSNIALNQRASQTHNSTWNGWTWTADYAVDGCRLADNPDDQQCCSTSDDGWNLPNWWRVDFDQHYLIDEGVITGRSGWYRDRLIAIFLILMYILYLKLCVVPAIKCLDLCHFLLSIATFIGSPMRIGQTKQSVYSLDQLLCYKCRCFSRNSVLFIFFFCFHKGDKRFFFFFFYLFSLEMKLISTNANTQLH